MKAWIPLAAGLTFSGVMLVAVRLGEPAPVVLPELAPAPPPPPPPAPFVRAIAAPRVETPPQELIAPQFAAAPEPVAVDRPQPDEPQELDPDTASPRMDPSRGPFRSAEFRLRKTQRFNQLLLRRQEKLIKAVATARETGDTLAEQKAQLELDRSIERLKAIQAQQERLKRQLTADAAR